MPAKERHLLYKNAKVVIIGNSGTGKSTLSLVLSGETFVPVSPSMEHQIRSLDRQEQSYNNRYREIREVFLWDLAGQPGCHLLHRLHLQDVAVVLLVFDTHIETSIAIENMYEWVRVVQHSKSERMSELKLFLVIPRGERPGTGWKQLQNLKEKLVFDHIFETSAKEGQGISELKKAILAAIDWEKLPGMSATTLQEITKLLLLKEQEGSQFYPEDELYNAFEKIWTRRVKTQNEDPRAQFQTCIRYIEVQGLIRPLSSNNYILLQPKSFDTYAAALFDVARDDPDGFGCIDVESARQGKIHLSKESDRIKDRALERMLLDSIERDFLYHNIAFYDLTFKARKHGPEQVISLIFPSQTSRVNVDLPDSWQKYYTFHFYSEVTSLYWRLVAYLSSNNPFTKHDLWRNAVTYTSGSGEMCGVSLQKHNETHAELAICFDDGVSEETRNLFAAYIYVYLRSHDQQAWGKPVLHCPCGCIFTEEQERKARERRNSTITCSCGESTVRLPRNEALLALVPDFQQPDYHVVAQRRAEEVRSRKALNDYDVFFCHDDDEEDKREIGEICNELEKRGIVTWFRERDMRPGKLTLSENSDQMQQRKAAVICFGNKNGNQHWIDLQMASLLEQFKKRHCRIIPVLLKHAPPKKQELLPYFETKWVDFHNWNPHPIDELIWGITDKRP